MSTLINRIWCDDTASDIAEYALMLTVLIVFVLGVARIFGSNGSGIFIKVGSALNIASRS